MRRTILTSLAAAALAMVIPVSLAAAAPETADTPGESARDQPILSTARMLEPMRLGCEVRTTDEGSVVGCKWSEPTSRRAASVRLFRLDPEVDPHRMVVYRSENLAETALTDTKVRAGHRYAYAVQTYDVNGRVVGRSRAEWVRIPPIDDPAVEVLKLACGLGDSGEWVGCEWSRPVSADAAVVSLWRSVDGGARELVEQFRPQGPAVYRDAVPAGARSVTYAVVATTDSDRVVARSRPVTVRIPDVHEVEVLKLACGLGDSGEWVGCEWSRPVSADAAVVSLWRSVDGGARELVEQFRPQGPAVYRDAVPAGARSVTYAVVATTDSDRVVARSRPVTVRIPQNDVRPVDTVPVDTRPVDTVSPDTVPPVTRPVATVPPVTVVPVTIAPVTVAPNTVPPITRPVDTRPVDTRPVDTRPVGAIAP